MAKRALRLRAMSIALVGLMLFGLGGVAVAAQGSGQQTKLVFWDTNNSGVQKEIVEQLAKEFEQENPGVTVEHKGWTTDDLQKTLPRAIASGDAPDVAQINNGENSMGPLVRAGDLVSMDKYDAQYGWSQEFSAGLLARDRYSPDGKTFGQGTLGGVSMTGEIVGFYYNRKIFQDNGIQIPKTFADLEAAMQTLKDKGVTPLVFGNLNKEPAIHLWGSIWEAMTPRDYLDGLIYRNGNQSWDSESVKQSAAIVQEWEKKGYLMQGSAGVDADTAWKLFAAGKGAMYLTGSWLAGDLAANMGDNVGFFLMPPMEGQPALSVGGVGIPYGILKTAKNPDLAARFVNFLVSDRAVQLLIEKGELPARQVPASEIKPNTLSGDLYAAWDQANQNDAIGHYPDWATPTMYDTLEASLQELLGHQATPDAFAKALQEDYAQFLASQK